VNRPSRAEPAAAPRGREELRVWAGLVLAAAVFVGLGMAWRAWFPAAGMPLEPPWFRSADALFAAADSLGAAGRSQHRTGVLTLDTAIPLAYGWALFRAGRFYLDRLGAPASLRTLRWIPVAAMLCDFAENACIVALLGAPYVRRRSAGVLGARLQSHGARGLAREPQRRRHVRQTDPDS
jgi:hypothetical protein